MGRSNQERQSGNVLIAIIAAIAAVGVLGSVTMSTLRGPVTGMQRVTKYTVAENDMLAASILLSRHSLSSENPDCDGDGMIEPVPFAEGMESAPAGGGLIPPDTGAARLDPWGGAYGYCAWDHGAKILDDACGADANRLRGGDTETGTALAVISAGPDRIFQSSCVEWVDEDTPTVVKPEGSDDIIRLMPYGSFLLPQVSQARVEALPDEACTGQTTGTMRMQEGSVQVCTDVGWTEVGTSAFSDSNFEPVTNAALNHQYTSGPISFQGFLNRRDVAVTEGAAILIINGVPSGTEATIEAGDTIALRATSAPVPETTYSFAISVGGVRKVWSIRTRDFTPAYLTITPTSAPMVINTPGTPGYGDTVSFIVRNTGEVATGPMQASLLSNTSNFEFYAGGTYHGDDCAAKNLAANEFCVIDVRPRASNDGAYSGTLTARTASLSVQAGLSLNATGWSCPVPWGGTTAHNTSITAYQSATAPWNGSCQNQTRNCNLGVLSGSYTHQSCNVTPTTYAYGSWGGYGSCTKTCGGGTQTRTRTCIRQNDGASVACALCGGDCTQTQACNTQSCCSGTLVGGYCWYKSANGGSCSAVCSSRGGDNIAGTRNYVGSGGTEARCNSVLSAIGAPGSSTQKQIWHAYPSVGCVSHTSGIRYRIISSTTTAGAAVASGWIRACACNN